MRIESWVDMGNLVGAPQHYFELFKLIKKQMRELDKVPKAIACFDMASHLDPSNVKIHQSLRELIDAS